MDPKLLNTLKLIATALVGAAASIITLKTTGAVEVSQWLVDASTTAVALGSAFGIVSSGIKPAKPKRALVEPPAPTPPVAP